MFESVKVSARGTPDAIVAGVFKDESLKRDTKALDPTGALTNAAQRTECTGDLGRICEAYPAGAKATAARIMLVGLGSKDAFSHGSLRTVAAAVGRRLAQTKDTKISVELAPALKGTRRLDLAEAGRCFGEGLGLLAWNFTDLRGTGTDSPKRTSLSIRSGDKGFADGIKRGLALATSANTSRTLGATPANIAHTEYVADYAKKIARSTAGLTCRVISGAQLEKENLQGLINVGKASEHGPCLIRLEYKPTRVKRGVKPAVLVGKTIVYDTGGLSLKTGGSMAGMKGDKDGGCAVLGAMHAIATVIKPNRPVVALLACAENSVSDEAYRPDDVLRFRNGVTVEVTNTDAEGRLVLADALIWACEKEKPGFIIDMATLTGGVVVALGSTYAGMWCDDDELRGRLEKASETSGERVWRLPHHDEYRRMMKVSPVADCVNSAPVRKAHPIQGAAFLSFFVDKDIPWAHIDVAGVHTTEDGGPFVKGPTGFGTRLLADLFAQD